MEQMGVYARHLHPSLWDPGGYWSLPTAFVVCIELFHTVQRAVYILKHGDRTAYVLTVFPRPGSDFVQELWKLLGGRNPGRYGHSQNVVQAAIPSCVIIWLI